MIIVDTAVWIDHLARRDDWLAFLIEDDRVLVHPYVVGEIMLGTIAQREIVVARLGKLPQILPSRHHEVMALITSAALSGSGIGYVDAHLLAATLQRRNCSLWTRDRRLDAAAERLGVKAMTAAD